MATEPNENREDELEDEDFDLDEDDAAEGEDDTPSDADDEDEDEDGGSEEGSDDDDADEDEEGDEDDDEDEDEDEDPDYDPKLDPSGKFKGKSKKEIMQSYRNLERSIGTKAQEMAQAILKRKGVKAKPNAGDEEDVDFDLGLTDEEIAKMKPGEFGKHISKKILEKATEIAHNTIERTNEVRGNVSREIREATEAHPHLKENADYREIVINMIEAAAGRGEALSLKEACKKADKAMNITPKKKEGGDGDGIKKKKKNRMAVEKPGGSDGGKVKSDADRVREGLLGGKTSTEMLGGMGV